VIVVTNQAGIAKGYYTWEQMEIFNRHLNYQLQEKYGAHIDAFYACPHHPDYTGECDCRKPKPGLFFRASQDFSVDFSQSVMYGDKESDQLAALAAGIKDFRLVTCSNNV
jgi:D-glycero-D-manno-heptose 1,7-bisphosphate phosphatase